MICLPSIFLTALFFLFFIFCRRKNSDRLGQRFILANVLPKDTLLTYGVRLYFYKILSRTPYRYLGKGWIDKIYFSGDKHWWKLRQSSSSYLFQESHFCGSCQQSVSCTTLAFVVDVKKDISSYYRSGIPIKWLKI